MNAKGVADWLFANGIGILATHEPEYMDEPATVDCIGEITVLVYEEAGVASVVRKNVVNQMSPKVLDPVDTYLGVVSNVKSLLPPRGTGKPSGAWDL